MLESIQQRTIVSLKPFHERFWSSWSCGLEVKKLVLESQDSLFESRHEQLLGGNLFALNPRLHVLCSLLECWLVSAVNVDGCKISLGHLN